MEAGQRICQQRKCWQNELPGYFQEGLQRDAGQCDMDSASFGNFQKRERQVGPPGGA